VRTAWSKLRQAALAQSLIRRQIEDEVEQSYQNYLTSTEKLHELDAQIRAAQEAYRQAKAGFDAGTAIYLEVLAAQNVLLDSELQVATEAYNQKVVFLDLLRTIGRIKSVTIQQNATTRPATGPTTVPATMPATR